MKEWSEDFKQYLSEHFTYNDNGDLIGLEHYKRLLTLE